MMQVNINERLLKRRCDDYAGFARQHGLTDWNALEETMGTEYAESRFERSQSFVNRAYDRVDTIAMMLDMHICALLNWWRGCKRVKTQSARKALLEYYIEHGWRYYQTDEE